MGTGSTRTRQVNRQIQVPSAPKRRTRTPSPTILIEARNHSRRPFSSQPSPWLTKTNTQRLQTNSTLAHYATIWEQNGKLSSTFEQRIRSESKKMEHNQKEVSNQELTTKHSSTYQTALIESTLKSEMESIHQLSTSEKVDTLILNLKQSHTDFDDSIKRRIGQITSQTESVLQQIVQETEENQQNLLIQAREQQTIQDEEDRTLLETFLKQLDEKRAKQLALIQEQLQEQRLEIFNESQLKIRALTEQANYLKTQIMSEEERKTSDKIDNIVNEINSISAESAIENVGAQIKTNFHLTIIETVGSNNSQYQSQHQHLTKKTSYIENNTRRPSSTKSSDRQTKSINKLAKQNPTNPKIQSEQPQ